MKFAFYPGCSLEGTAWDYDRSVRACCEAMDIELEEIPDWVCCGSTPAHTSNATLAVALPVINLQKAHEMGKPVMTACASCYSRLRTANHKVRGDADERARAQRVTGKEYQGEVDVFHIVDVLVNLIGMDAIRARIKHRLEGLRVACYYGCLLTRPPEIAAFENAEHPSSMEGIVEAVGATPVEWPLKTECCGAGLSLTNAAVVGRLGHKLLSMARMAGANCLAVGCPLCQMNLDLRQADAVKAHGPLPETPVLYITQILGIALGLTPAQVGIEGLTIDAKQLLEHCGARPAEASEAAS